MVREPLKGLLSEFSGPRFKDKARKMNIFGIVMNFKLRHIPQLCTVHCTIGLEIFLVVKMT